MAVRILSTDKLTVAGNSKKVAHLWVRASASEAVDLGLIPSRVKPMTLNLVFTISLLDAQHERKRMKNKPASLDLLVVSSYSALKLVGFAGTSEHN